MSEASERIDFKTKDFRTYCEKINLEHSTNFEFEISEYAMPILEKLFNPKVSYRSVGILLENFNSCDNEQKSLFYNFNDILSAVKCAQEDYNLTMNMIHFAKKAEKDWLEFKIGV